MPALLLCATSDSDCRCRKHAKGGEGPRRGCRLRYASTVCRRRDRLLRRPRAIRGGPTPAWRKPAGDPKSGEAPVESLMRTAPAYGGLGRVTSPVIGLPPS